MLNICSKLFFICGQCGDEFIQFYTDLCVFALNVDKVYWEKLVKEGAATGEEAMARKRDMAKVLFLLLLFD